MIEVGQLIVKLTANTTDFDKQLAQARYKVETFARSSMYAGMSMTMALTGPIAYIARTALAFDDLKYRSTIVFNSITGNVEKTNGFIKQLMAFSARTPFVFDKLLQQAQALAGMRVPIERIIPALEAIGNASLIRGGSLEQWNQRVETVVQQIGRMVSSGRVYNRVIMEITRMGVPAIQALADAYGKTTTEMRKLITKGAVPARDAFEILVKAMEERGMNLMRKQVGSLQQQLSNLAEVALYTLGDLFKPLYDSARKWLGQAQEYLRNMWASIASMPQETKQKIVALLGALAAVGPILLVLSGLLRLISIMSSRTGTVAGALTLLVYWLISSKDAMSTFGGVLQSVGNVLKAAFDWFNNLPEPIKNTTIAVVLLTSALRNLGVASALSGLFGGAAAGATPTLTKLFGGAAAAQAITDIKELEVATRGATVATTGLAAANGTAALSFGSLVVAAAPWVALAGLIAGGIYLIYKGLSEDINHMQRAKRAMREQTETSRDLAEGQAAVAKEVVDLVKKHDALSKMTKRTTEQDIELQRISEQIQALSPGLVKGFDNQTHSLGLVANAANLAAQSYRNLSAEARAFRVQTLRQTIDEQKAIRDAAYKQIEHVASKVNKVPGIFQSSKAAQHPNTQYFQEQMARWNKMYADQTNEQINIANEAKLKIDEANASLAAMARDSKPKKEEIIKNTGGLIGLEGGGGGKKGSKKKNPAAEAVKEWIEEIYQLNKALKIGKDATESASYAYDVNAHHVKYLTDAQKAEKLGLLTLIDAKNRAKEAQQEYTNSVKQFTESSMGPNTQAAWDIINNPDSKMTQAQKDRILQLGQEADARAYLAAQAQKQKEAMEALNAEIEKNIENTNQELQQAAMAVNHAWGLSRVEQLNLEIAKGDKSKYFGVPVEQLNTLRETLRRQDIADPIDDIGKAIKSLNDQLTTKATDEFEKYVILVNTIWAGAPDTKKNKVLDLVKAVREQIAAQKALEEQTKEDERQANAYDRYIDDLRAKMDVLALATNASRKSLEQLIDTMGPEKGQAAFNFMLKVTPIIQFQNMLKDFAEGVGNIFSDLVTNTKLTFSNMFSYIYQGFQQLLFKMAVEYLQSKIVQWMMGLLGRVFPVASGGGTGNAVTISGTFGSGMASGGEVFSGRGYIVGEEGPELFFPRRGGTIYSNRDSRQLAMAGETHYHFSFNISTPNAASFRKSQAEMFASAKAESERQFKRNR